MAEGEETHTEGRGGRDWRAAATRSWKRQGVLEECGRGNTLILDVWPPERGENEFLLFQATKGVVIFYSSDKKLIQFDFQNQIGERFKMKR